MYPNDAELCSNYKYKLSWKINVYLTSSDIWLDCVIMAYNYMNQYQFVAHNIYNSQIMAETVMENRYSDWCVVAVELTLDTFVFIKTNVIIYTFIMGVISYKI